MTLWSILLFSLKFIVCTKICEQPPNERVECGWPNIDSFGCENLDCCFRSGDAIPCFLQGGKPNFLP